MPVELVTVDQALCNAQRLLEQAEVETDRTLMERLNCLADSWVAVADVLSQRSQV